MTLKYIIETFDNYKVINKINEHLDKINEIDLILSKIDSIIYKFNNIKIGVFHNTSRIIIWKE